MTATLITGNTFAHKGALKAMGGRWDAAAKGWRVPAEKAAEANALVGGSREPKMPKSKLSATADANKNLFDRARAWRAPRALKSGEDMIYRPTRGKNDSARFPGEEIELRDGRRAIVVDGARARGSALQACDEYCVWHIIKII
jgi:hypothetical protein